MGLRALGRGRTTHGHGRRNFLWRSFSGLSRFSGIAQAATQTHIKSAMASDRRLFSAVLSACLLSTALGFTSPAYVRKDVRLPNNFLCFGFPVLDLSGDSGYSSQIDACVYTFVTVSVYLMALTPIIGAYWGKFTKETRVRVPDPRHPALRPPPIDRREDSPKHKHK